MKRKILSAIMIAGMATGTHTAFASNTITFDGSVTAQTCTINSSNGTNNFTVTLPPVSANALSTAGQTAGDTAFTILLTGCTPDSGNVRTHFEAGGTVNPNGRLTNQTGNAKNVEIQLLNSDASVIKAGDAVASQNSKQASLNAGSASLSYVARYFATGAATAGTLNTVVNYSIAYQ
ncbi:fimbrial protein [Achromobacter aegrifaciens]|uniref:fimbrial protein n=1 Tax=Achromobacter aegrifaciens TaxID=1287736 RepID=UPI0027B8B95F|nr:fimbrial protein [Achromobacter aegrifaciens]WLW62215.1 fimbrial protein [Achromobacter aegrifaciens]